jgi:hypothetical protein
MSEIITDEEIKTAFAYSYQNCNHREVLSQAVLKTQAGFICGGTISQIMVELNLAKQTKNNHRSLYLTKKGKLFLHESFKIEGH